VLDLGGLSILARSIGGLETCIELPGLRLCFDLGRCPPSAVHRPLVLFTHAHMDHLGGIAYHAATRALMGLAPPTYVVPPHAQEPINALFDAWRRLDESPLPHRLVALGPGESFGVTHEVAARAFQTPHTVRSQGYALLRSKRKLRPEYRGLDQAELDDLRTRQGVEITRVEEEPIFAFTGDTRAVIVENETLVRRAKVLVMECTFLDERVPPAQAHATGHVHLDDLVERAELFENEAILLTHLSARYTRREALALFDAKLPPGLRARVTPLLDGHKP
jgi:ribonuclease Z